MRTYADMTFEEVMEALHICGWEMSRMQRISFKMSF